MVLALLLKSLLSLDPAGTPVEPPGQDVLGRAVTEIVVEGVDPEGVEGLEGIVGEPLTRPVVRDLIDGLWASDRYRDVRIDALPVSGGVRLVVVLDLRRRIRTLDSSGNDHLDLRDLRRIAGFVPDAEEHPDLLNDMRGRMETAYAERGYPNAEVRFEVEETGEPGRVGLLAVVDEGEPIRLASVRLTGTLVYPERMVRDVLDVAPGDPWDQVALEAAGQRLVDFYRDQGYLLASVGEPLVEPRDDGRVDIGMAIDAGLPVRIVFGGNGNVTAAELASVVHLDEEPDLSATGLGNACDRIVAHYGALGFPDAAASWSLFDGSADDGLSEGWSEPPAPDPFGPLWAPEEPPIGAPTPVRYLRIRVDEGPRLRVARIEWEGNEHLTDENLDDTVASFVESAIATPALFQPFPPGELGSLGLSGETRLAEAGRLPPVLPRRGASEVFVESAYREAAVQVAQQYHSEGFLDARVTLREARRDARAGTIVPVFGVVEGPRSMLQSIGAEGNDAIPGEKIEGAFLIEAGEPVNELFVEQTRRAILETYASDGYLYAEVRTNVAFTPDRTLADVVYAIVEGPQVRVRAIEVTGNEETSTSLILGTLTFTQGEVFSPEAAQTSEQRLLRIGVFQGVTITPAAADVPEADKTILVQVRERPPQMLELRGGFSTAEGVRGSFEYGYRNLFGYAIGLHLRLKLNYQLFFLGNDAFESYFDTLSLEDQLERSVSAGVNLPYLPGLGGILATQFDFANERDNQPYYGLDRTSAFLGFSTTLLGKLLSLQVRGGIEYNDVAAFGKLPAVCTAETLPGEPCLTPTDARRLRTPDGISTFGVVNSSVTVDWRDSAFNPTRGIYFSASAEWVRSFAPVDDPDTDGVVEHDFSNLVKTSFLLSGYVPLVKGMVVALSARYGQIFQLQPDSITFPDRYYYLGGSDTIRGFSQESVSVADAAYKSPQPGGDLFLVFRTELRFPLTDSLSGALFSDVGNLWRDPTRFDITEMRYTAGLGLRLGTPIGPLAFDYGVNLDPRGDWGEEFGALHFSIGMF